MAELVGDQRKLNFKSIVEKYKIHKEIERGTSCGAAVRKYVFAKQSLFNWIAAVEGNNLVNLSMFAENNQIVGLVRRVSRIAEIELVATLKLRRHNKLLCIYIYNHILFKNQHIFKQKNMKILFLFLPKNPDKWDIFKKSH